jgi:anti-anti-sigma factor
MEAKPRPTFRVERHRNIAVIHAPAEMAGSQEDTLERAGTAALNPLRDDPPGGLVIDLSQVDYFGSIFLSFLIRCHTLAKKQGSRMAIAGASVRAQELLRLTALDTLWSFYPDHSAAVRALASA